MFCDVLMYLQQRTFLIDVLKRRQDLLKLNRRHDDPLTRGLFFIRQVKLSRVKKTEHHQHRILVRLFFLFLQKTD